MKRVFPKILRPLFSMVLLSLTVFFTLATSPDVPVDPPAEQEEEDEGPCGDDQQERAVLVFQNGQVLADGDQVSITSGGPQGGAGEEGIDVFVHLQGVASDAVEPGPLVLSFLDDAGEIIVSRSLGDGGFACFSGELRTRVINLTLPISSFELDGLSGTLEVEAHIGGTPLTLSQSIRY